MPAFPIHNDDDLRRALAHVETLFHAAPDTPEGTELEVMLALIEAYERQHHSMSPGDPREIIAYKMGELRLSQRALAKRLGWGGGRVSEVLSGKRALTMSMVEQLSAVLGIRRGELLGDAAAGGIVLPDEVADALHEESTRIGVPVAVIVADAVGDHLRRVHQPANSVTRFRSTAASALSEKTPFAVLRAVAA